MNDRCWLLAVVGRELHEALADCNKSLRLRPDSATTLDSRGLVYVKLGLFDKAIADYSAVLTVDPKQAPSYYGRGYAKDKNGDSEGAAADSAAAKSIQPDIAEEYAKNRLK